MNIENKVCIITGAGSGIGRATAKRLAMGGAKVVLIGRTESKVEAVHEEIEVDGGRAIAFGLDVADHDGVRHIRDLSRSLFAKPSIRGHRGNRGVRRELLRGRRFRHDGVLEADQTILPIRILRLVSNDIYGGRKGK